MAQETQINTPGGIRTHDLWFRKPSLYPTELRVLRCLIIVFDLLSFS